MFVFALFWAVISDKIFSFSKLICSESPSIFVFLSKSLWLIIVGESYSVCFILMNKTQITGRFVFKQGWTKFSERFLLFMCLFFGVQDSNLWHHTLNPYMEKAGSGPSDGLNLTIQNIWNCCFAQKYEADKMNNIYVFVFMYIQNRLKSLVSLN